MSADEMVCKELVELITDYLEGTLPSEARARFEAHVARCGGCAHYIAQMEATIRLTGMLSESDLTLEARQDLLHLFRNWKHEPSAD